MTNPDYSWTTPEGQEVLIRVGGPSTYVFEHDDGSRLTVTQDVDGNREYAVSPWPPEGATA